MIRALAVAALGIAALAGCGRELPSFTTAQLDAATLAADAVDATRLQTHVEAIVAERFLETPVFTTIRPDKPISHERSAGYLRTQFEQLGYTPVVESTTRDDGLVINNVYVEIPGATRPDEIVLLTAHHDAYYSAGADDNASGVAARSKPRASCAPRTSIARCASSASISKSSSCSAAATTRTTTLQTTSCSSSTPT